MAAQSTGMYALIQFSPVPERMEFLNIGLLMLVPNQRFVGIRFARGQSRLDRVFGRQSKVYIEAIKDSFENRLRQEIAKGLESGYDEFVRRRANDIRLSPLLPVLVGDAEAEFENLFDELVGDDDKLAREPRIRRKLREAFEENRVEMLLDKPEEVDLPEYGMKVSVPYGYQNGCYNFIDGMRIPRNVSDGLREAGKRAMEGGLIWKHFQNEPLCKRLVVVGDFSEQSNGFYQAVSDQFEGANVRLYRLDDLRPLFKDIIENAEAHGRIAN
jgi:hypothetical protein